MVGSLFLTLLEFEEKIKVLKDTYKDEKLMLKEKFEQDQNQLSYIKKLIEFVSYL